MFNIVLYQPEIPPNTGNIIRLCANTGCRLGLVEPLGFDLDDSKLRRAGLDYREWARVERYPDIEKALRAAPPGTQVYAMSTRGNRSYADARFVPGDTLVFGPETRGLPADFLDALDRDQCLRIPMQPGSRSLNLSNAVAVITYEALRQNGFSGGDGAAPLR